MNAQGAINTREEAAASAHKFIRNAYYGIADNVYTMINIADVTDDDELKELCRTFINKLHDRLEDEHPNWD